MDNNQIAERLYERYCAAVGGVAFNGDKLPTWAEFSSDPGKTKQANAWLAVAEEARGLWPITSDECTGGVYPL